LYAKQRHDAEKSTTALRYVGLYLQLRAELEANRRIVVESLETIDRVLASQPQPLSDNDPIYDEQLYVAPLFADSWAALSNTDAHRVLPASLLDRLFEYYTSVARANWLIQRVQVFKYRAPILREIRETLLNVQPPKADLAFQLSDLRDAL